MTGTCRAEHIHVVWDPSRLPWEVITVVAQQLLNAAADPDGTWQPPAAAPGDFATLMRPDNFTALLLLSQVLWAAGAAGHGVREAMDWLSSHQSERGGRVLPLDEQTESAAPDRDGGVRDLGPAHARQEAVYLAWQALARVE